MADTADNAGASNSATAKPWGDDANFDAERAWALIQGLRSDKAALTQEIATAKAEKAAAEKERDDAVKSADDAKKDLASDRRDAILKEFDIDPDVAEEFLSGDLSLDELRRKAERLGGLKKPAEDPKPKAGDEDGDDPAGSGDDPAPKLPGRPKTKPSTGEAGGSASAELDLDELAVDARD